MNKRLVVSLLSVLTVIFSQKAEVVRQSIDDGWKFSQARQGNWYPAKVPGEVHTDLMRENIIEDPFIAQNERSVQWVDKEDWIYETMFNLDSRVLCQSNIDMIFKGLDTYADVYLNGHLILKADNMFREWNVPVKEYLHDGDNVLKVYFHSPIKVDMPKYDQLSFAYEACNDQSENGGIFDKRVSVFARKAGYHYGWDWGPRLVTSGIWRPILLEGWSECKIDNMFVRTQTIGPKKALLDASFAVISDKKNNCKAEIVDLKTGKILASKTVSVDSGMNAVSIPFCINDPKLWWCNGLGNPYLYEIGCNLKVKNDIVACSKVTTGVRTIEVVRDKDSQGTSFYFKLNGVPVFAKGANYIPCDNFLSRVTCDVYDRTIKDAVDVNMNMLRVWGGGIYEDDYFYDLCDRNGIMVWQDFMFACSLYPSEGELLENIKKEAIDNVVRLRNHPSITIWCGNNECLEAWYGWGWKSRYEKLGVDTIIWNQYDSLFHKILPSVVSEYDPGVFYWPTSPFSRYEGVAEANNGDSHLWTIWGQSEPIDDYNHERSRFFSEYGFQSFPTFETVKKYAPDSASWNINSDVMMAHQRGGKDANNRIKNYLEASYPQPKDFESFLYMTQLLQGDAIRTAIEAHRRDKPYCMGSLFWQINDCWPVASWSSRDYYGNWKAQHYFARKAFDDIMLSNVVSGDTLSVYTVSDFHGPVKGELKLKVITIDGKVVFINERCVSLPVDGVLKQDFLIDSITGLYDKSKLIIVSQFKADGVEKAYESISMFLKQKDMNYMVPDIKWTVTESDGAKWIELSSETFVRGLFLSLPFDGCKYSDNFIDLLPGRNVKISLTTDQDIESVRNNLKVYYLSK